MKTPTSAQKQASAVAAACRAIEAAPEPPRLALLAKGARMSPFHFHRVFKKHAGLTPKAYAAARRAERVRASLTSGGTVTAAFHAAGYGSSGRFYAESTAVLGMTPRDFRAGGAGAVIRFGVGECGLGSILAAASVKGVCAILLGPDPDVLVKDLQDRFPKARLVGGDRAFERVMAAVVGMVERPGLGLRLPLDVRGTVFQRRVWAALRRIPAGSTATYSEIARRIGAPKSARAVAGACAANALAIAIPCHRVVRGDGALSGYRWGVERKRSLLARER